jgi:carbohydrate diacid regulator
VSLAVVARQFDQVAEAVAERTAELLCTRVWVTGHRGTVVASSEGLDIGRALPPQTVAHDGWLRVPIEYGTSRGEVIVAEPTNGEAVPPRLGSALVDLMIHQAIVVAELPNRHVLKNKFIHDLLRGRIDNEADIMREGQMLGMDLTLPRAVLLIDAADYILAADEYRHAAAGRDARAQRAAPPSGEELLSTAEARIPRRAQFVIASIVGFFSLPSDTICAYIGDGEVAILKASGTQDLVAWTDDDYDHAHSGASWADLAALKRAASALLSRLRHDTRANVSIGIGRYHPGIPGLAHSHAAAHWTARWHTWSFARCRWLARRSAWWKRCGPGIRCSWQATAAAPRRRNISPRSWLGASSASACHTPCSH